MKKNLLCFFTLFASLTLHAQCTELFISEYVEGTGNDKALEIYNPTNSPINLTGYRLERFANGDLNSSSGGILNLSGTIAAYSTFVIVNGQTTGQSGGSSPAVSLTLQAIADQLDGAYPAPCYFTGNDAVVLYKNNTIIDIFGKIGENPGQGWTDVFPYTDAQGVLWTNNHTLRRKTNVAGGVAVNPTVFNVTVEYDSVPNNTWSGLGTHNCNCSTPCSVVSQPISVNTTINSSVQFTSLTTVTGITGFQWQSNPNNFGWMNIPANSSYSGVATNNLSVNSAQLSNHHQPFRVIATSGTCIDTSDIALLSILDTCTITVNDTISVIDTTYISITDTLIINTTLSGINPPGNVNTIKIYPNPASTHLFIDNGNFSSMNGYTIKIDNSLGQTVFNQQVSQQQFYVDLSSWSGNGTYFVYLIDNLSSIIEIRKVVLQ